MNIYIKIIKGYWRIKDVSGLIAPLVKDYQQLKIGSYVTIDVSKIDGFDGLKNARIRLDSMSDYIVVSENDYKKSGTFIEEETDEEIMSRITKKFQILTDMTYAVLNSQVKALIVSGPPGIGKSYGVANVLDGDNFLSHIGNKKLKTEIISGSISPLGLYQKLYEYSKKDCVICFDDCDIVLYDDVSLNLLKAALDTSKKRIIHWNKESTVLEHLAIPKKFSFEGGIIFITNLNFDSIRSKKIKNHLIALMSRCHYLDLSIKSYRDIMLRIKQICRDGMLDSYGIDEKTRDEIVQFIDNNRHRLREISLRTVLKIADLWKMNKKDYKYLAEHTCMVDK